MEKTTTTLGAITPGTNIRWEQCYEIEGYHWALVSDESSPRGVINAYTVLFTSCETDMGGKSIGEQPDLLLYADAHNTYNACGLTPSELLARLREAEAKIEKLNERWDSYQDHLSRPEP